MASNNVLVSAAVGLTAGVFGLVFGPGVALGCAALGFLLTLGALSASNSNSSVTITAPSVRIAPTPWYRRVFVAPTLHRVPAHHHGIRIGHPQPSRTIHVTPPRVVHHHAAPRPPVLKVGPSHSAPIRVVPSRR